MILFLFVASLLAQTRSTANAVPLSANSAYSVLVGDCSTADTRPRTAAEWEKLVTGLGMKQKDHESPWSLTTALGEVRATAFSLGAPGTSYWIMFFPSSAE